MTKKEQVAIAKHIRSITVDNLSAFMRFERNEISLETLKETICNNDCLIICLIDSLPSFPVSYWHVDDESTGIPYVKTDAHDFIVKYQNR